MNDDRRKAEIDANFDFLQRNLAHYLPEHEGEYALLKARNVVGLYAKPGDAYREGLSRYPDHIFSIQEVTGEPLDLGFFSYAGA